jgi:uncharacterized membrane protein HdeD (DUF308 family)
VAKTAAARDDTSSHRGDPRLMSSIALNEVSGSLLLAAGVLYLWFEAWTAGGLQRSAASLVAFVGLVLIVRGVVAMEPRLRARRSKSGRDARSPG